MNGEWIIGSLSSVGLVLLSSGHLSCLCLCPLRRGEVQGLVLCPWFVSLAFEEGRCGCDVHVKLVSCVSECRVSKLTGT